MKLCTGAGAVLALLAVIPAAQAGSSLPKLALRASQVGPGYKLQLRPDTNCVASCATLDLCDGDFPSEADRTARYQVNYRHTGKTVQLSNEIVTYRDGAAADAKDEIGFAAETCPHTPVPSHEKGISALTYRIKRLHDARLPAGALALQIRVTGKNGKQAFDNTLVAVYQYRGDVFSGIYAYPGPGITLAEQTRIGLHAAEGSAENLRRRVPA